MVSVVVVRCRKIEALPCRALSQKESKQMENRKANTPIALRKQIGGTMYCVRVHFNEDAKETMKDKIKRMLVSCFLISIEWTRWFFSVFFYLKIFLKTLVN